MNNNKAMTKKASIELSVADKNLGDCINSTLQSRDKSHLEIGNLVLEHFDNDLEELSNKSSTKTKSLRKIVKAMVIGTSFTEIHRMVQVTIQDDFFDQEGIDVSSASYSQKAEFVSLPNNSTKKALIQEACEHKWSVRRLREEVRKAKGGLEKVKKVTEPPKSASSSFSRLSGDLLNLAEVLKPLVQDLETMDRKEIVILQDETIEGRGLLKSLETQYEALLGAINSRLEALGG